MAADVSRMFVFVSHMFVFQIFLLVLQKVSVLLTYLIARKIFMWGHRGCDLFASCFGCKLARIIVRLNLHLVQASRYIYNILCLRMFVIRLFFKMCTDTIGMQLFLDLTYCSQNIYLASSVEHHKLQFICFVFWL